MRSLTEIKSALRNDVLARRNRLTEGDRIEMSLRAAEFGVKAPQLSTDNLLPGTVVSGFLPIRSEIDPRPLMAELARRGARLCLPVVTSKTDLEFRQMVRGAPLVESAFGTIGPDEHATVLDPQILLMPLSVFDGRGGRIGYGGGFYDRAIKNLLDKNIEVDLLGMGFSIQEVADVPMEKHDQFLHGIITEKPYRSF
ncbi:MAG: 5-formyltetrahydrofolate cyclo-ligase [Rhizobiaceae bacterium]|nr:5-formyltetrahydrofolate cyclo-ligase [Rhizobiaceae bacterium]